MAGCDVGRPDRPVGRRLGRLAELLDLASLGRTLCDTNLFSLYRESSRLASHLVWPVFSLESARGDFFFTREYLVT